MLAPITSNYYQQDVSQLQPIHCYHVVCDVKTGLGPSVDTCVLTVHSWVGTETGHTNGGGNQENLQKQFLITFGKHWINSNQIPTILKP